MRPSAVVFRFGSKLCFYTARTGTATQPGSRKYRMIGRRSFLATPVILRECKGGLSLGRSMKVLAVISSKSKDGYNGTSKISIQTYFAQSLMIGTFRIGFVTIDIEASRNTTKQTPDHCRVDLFHTLITKGLTNITTRTDGLPHYE